MATTRQTVTLRRYFIWANRVRTHFDESLDKKGVPDEHSIMLEPYMSYWYAGLYVVIEGWKGLGLRDEKIDSLLDSPNVDLLRRYRNGVFSFSRRVLRPTIPRVHNGRRKLRRVDKDSES
jgi:hypothetical protein